MLFSLKKILQLKFSKFLKVLSVHITELIEIMRLTVH